MSPKHTPVTGLALAIRDEHIAELEAEVAGLETQLAAARQEAQGLRTAACTRCVGSAIDPEDSSPGVHHDRGEEPPAPEPCRDCVLPDGAEPRRSTFSPDRRAAAHQAVLNLLAQHHPDADNTTTHGGTGEPRGLADDAAAYTDAVIRALTGGE